MSALKPTLKPYHKLPQWYENAEQVEARCLCFLTTRSTWMQIISLFWKKDAVVHCACSNCTCQNKDHSILRKCFLVSLPSLHSPWMERVFASKTLGTSSKFLLKALLHKGDGTLPKRIFECHKGKRLY